MPVGRVESTVTVARPPEDVFAFFLDFDKYGEERVESVVKEPEGPTSAGTVFRFGNGKGRETTMRFTSLEPNRKIEFDGDVGPLKPVGAFIIEPTEGGSTLTIRSRPIQSAHSRWPRPSSTSLERAPGQSDSLKSRPQSSANRLQRESRPGSLLDRARHSQGFSR